MTLSITNHPLVALAPLTTKGLETPAPMSALPDSMVSASPNWQNKLGTIRTQVTRRDNSEPEEENVAVEQSQNADEVSQEFATETYEQLQSNLVDPNHVFRSLSQLPSHQRKEALLALPDHEAEALFTPELCGKYSDGLQAFDWKHFAWDTYPQYCPTAAWGLATLSTISEGEWVGGDEQNLPTLVHTRLNPAGFTVRPLHPSDPEPQAKVSDAGSPRSVRGLMASRDDVVLISYRGTHSALDALYYDLQVCPQEGFGGRVHKGFATGTEELWPELHTALKQHEAQNGGKRARIFVTGHSLGGSMALLTGHRLFERGYNLAGVYIFGSPRSVDKSSSRSFEKPGLGDRIWRIKNHGDAIVGLIPSGGLSPYVHVGQPIYLTNQGLADHSLSEKEIDDAEMHHHIERTMQTRTLHISAIKHHNCGIYANKMFLNRDLPRE